MKSRLVTPSLLAASLLGAAVLIGCNAESTTSPTNDPASTISPTATTVSFDVTEMT